MRNLRILGPGFHVPNAATSYLGFGYQGRLPPPNHFEPERSSTETFWQYYYYYYYYYYWWSVNCQLFSLNIPAMQARPRWEVKNTPHQTPSSPCSCARCHLGFGLRSAGDFAGQPFRVSIDNTWCQGRAFTFMRSYSRFQGLWGVARSGICFVEVVHATPVLRFVANCKPWTSPGKSELESEGQHLKPGAGKP